MKVKFSDVLVDVTKKATKIPKEEYLQTGLYQIIDQGQNEIAGYTNLESGLYSDVPAIIFGDHTRVLKYVDKPLFLGADGVKLIRPIDRNANTKYLFYALTSARIPNTGYNRHFKWLKQVEIPLPDAPTQERIVLILDKLSTLISLRKQQLAKLDELVKSRFVEMFGDETEYKELQNLCLIITDGTHQPPKFVEHGIPFLFVSNLIENILTYDTVKYIDKNTYDELIKRTPIEIGDVLLSTVGSYGHPAVVKSNRKFLFQRHIAYLKPDKIQIDSEYLHSAILSPGVQNQIENSVRGVAQKTLNLSEIKKIKIPVPSIEMQRAFSDYCVSVNRIKNPILLSLQSFETLKSSLMQQYFG